MNNSKALIFWAKKAELRKDLTRCGRCTKINENGFRTCDKCRDYSKMVREKRKVVPVTVDQNRMDSLTRRIASMELAIANLQLTGRNKYKKGYAKGILKIKKSETVYDKEDFKTHNFFDYSAITL